MIKCSNVQNDNHCESLAFIKFRGLLDFTPVAQSNPTTTAAVFFFLYFSHFHMENWVTKPFHLADRLGKEERGCHEDHKLSSLSGALALQHSRGWVSNSGEERELCSIWASSELKGESCIRMEEYQAQLGGRTLPVDRAWSLENHPSFKHDGSQHSFNVVDMPIWKIWKWIEVNSFPQSHDFNEEVHT